MKEQPIICFMGLDGSGKSTSINHAYEQLQKRGFDVEIVRAAYVIKYMSFFLKLGKRLVMKKKSDPYGGDYKAYLEKMRQQSKDGLIYRLFSALTTFEFKLQIWWEIKRKHKNGKLLLVDRYIYDNAVTYAANLGLGETYMRDTIQGKWKNAPKADCLIYIKTPVALCCSRKDDIPDPLYLEIREPLYDKIANMYGAVTISGSQSLDAMLNQVDVVVEDAIRGYQH